MWAICYHTMYMNVNFIFSIAILIMSVVIHEMSHGFAAEALGDPTPRLQGRLTLNPLKHLDWFGSVILPTISYMMGGVIFGWAKPVMINPYNLRGGRWGEAMVAIAGPISNIVLAIIFSQLIRFSSSLQLSQSFVTFSFTIVMVNLILAIFNLIPIPPLDGSKILYALLPQHQVMKVRGFFDQYGMIIVIFFLVFLGSVLSPVVNFFLKILI